MCEGYPPCKGNLLHSQKQLPVSKMRTSNTASLLYHSAVSGRRHHACQVKRTVYASLREISHFLFLCVLLVVLRLLGFILLVVFFGLFLILWNFNLFQWSIWINSELLGHQPINSIDQSRRVCDLVPGFNKCSLEKNVRRVHCSRVRFV